MKRIIWILLILMLVSGCQAGNTAESTGTTSGTQDATGVKTGYKEIKNKVEMDPSWFKYRETTAKKEVEKILEKYTYVNGQDNVPWVELNDFYDLDKEGVIIEGVWEDLITKYSNAALIFPDEIDGKPVIGIYDVSTEDFRERECEYLFFEFPEDLMFISVTASYIRSSDESENFPPVEIPEKVQYAYITSDVPVYFCGDPVMIDTLNAYNIPDAKIADLRYIGPETDIVIPSSYKVLQFSWRTALNSISAKNCTLQLDNLNSDDSLAEINLENVDLLAGSSFFADHLIAKNSNVHFCIEEYDRVEVGTADLTDCLVFKTNIKSITPKVYKNVVVNLYGSTQLESYCTFYTNTYMDTCFVYDSGYRVFSLYDANITINNYTNNRFNVREWFYYDSDETDLTEGDFIVGTTSPYHHILTNYGTADNSTTNSSDTGVNNSESSEKDDTFRIRIVANNIKIRSTPSAPKDNSNRVGNVNKDETYTVYETTSNEGYTWYRIGNDQWIADDGTWVEKID